MSDLYEDDSTESMETQGPINFVVAKTDENETETEDEENIVRVFEPTALVTLEEIDTLLTCVYAIRDNTEKEMFYINELLTVLINIKRTLIK